ncbi:RNA polymerase sigma factor, sigma-70 family [Flaviramulus basaltis]|uniref:RNA polymerase sigma factor, sigma-70 family n=1 Tax=Flaviramulus basaltis TaxID=369401 RepID=A0A1K2IAI0_9FLAO|nr:sigma-70 family RNA polymerase sigma factor [Flaviramulus basaltis]SFZ89413.1 RNA polymerase sigma factor, sigma-70 family [Flaviramulus basaltis]
MEQHYVDALKTNNNTITKELYNTNRTPFLNFAKRYNLVEADSVDIYQEAFISLRKHAISDKLYEVNCSLKTYLFGIGKHLIYKKLKENSLKKDYDSILHKINDNYEEIQIDSDNELTEEQQILQYYFKKLGKSCQQMLTLCFYRGLTNEEIAELEGYDSEAVVRSQKSRCLRTLKDLIKTSNP